MKNKILKLPLLMVVPLLLIGCNKTKISNNDELMKALKFEGVKLVQITETEGYKGTGHSELSPNVYREYGSNEGEEYDYYVAKEGEEYWIYTYSHGKWTKEQGDEDYFYSVKDIYESGYKEIVEEYGLSYDKLKYDNGQYTFTIKTGKELEVKEYTLVLKFEDKKLVYTEYLDDKGETQEKYEYEYKDITPVPPDVPELI
ncbi:MAG: hypothetical protein MJ206_02515 [Bacilli bacterium]|nr:hypothetical protein [Bacilli bacterium]